MLVSELQLKRDGDYIRFKDAPSRLTETITKATNQLSLKYGSSNTGTPPPDMIHYASFVKNPLRYIFDMIEESETSERVKNSRVKVVHEVVRTAMMEDPLSTVQSIILSLARVARF